jgi:hypothetical protein
MASVEGSHGSNCGTASWSSSNRFTPEHHRTETVNVSVLAPICVEKFQQQSDSAAKLMESKKAGSWDQRSLIEKAGWGDNAGHRETELGGCPRLF